jgi:hypothetical protein
MATLECARLRCEQTSRSHDGRWEAASEKRSRSREVRLVAGSEKRSRSRTRRVSLLPSEAQNIRIRSNSPSNAPFAREVEHYIRSMGVESSAAEILRRCTLATQKEVIDHGWALESTRESPSSALLSRIREVESAADATLPMDISMDISIGIRMSMCF